MFSLQRYMSIAQAGEIPFRLDESNTVSCGGVAGISNTFAGALWAAAYVSEAMSLGVEGINLHGNPNNCLGYTPLCAPTQQAIEAGALVPQPEWYALLLLRGLIGDRPLPTVVSALHGHNLQATTFLAPDGSLQAVIVDDDPLGTRRAYVRLKVGRRLPLRAATAADRALAELTRGGAAGRQRGRAGRHLDAAREPPGGTGAGRLDHARGEPEPRAAAVDRAVGLGRSWGPGGVGSRSQAFRRIARGLYSGREGSRGRVGPSS